MKKLITACMATFMLSGCLTPQNEAVRNLSYSQAVKAIPKGSSKDRVRSVLGKPDTVNSQNGEEMWSYVDQQVDIGKLLTPFTNSLKALDTKSFIIWFDLNGRVKRVHQGTFNL